MMQGQEQVPHDTSTEGAIELQSADHHTSDIVPAIVSEVNDVAVQGVKAETTRRNLFKYANIPPRPEKAKRVV